MLNLEDAIKNAVERICRDRNEDDKIYIHVSDLAGEAIRQHAKILHDMRRAAEKARKALYAARVDVLTKETDELAREALAEIDKAIGGKEDE